MELAFSASATLRDVPAARQESAEIFESIESGADLAGAELEDRERDETAQITQRSRVSEAFDEPVAAVA
jgi:hypothetical protein